ncbi:MAG: adenylate/guanylate cyclase domain-containing protein, partial [bacterium]
MKSVHAELLTGTVTFLFTDIEGSTILLQRLGDRRYREVLADHNRLLRAAFGERGGQEIQAQGDAFLVAFRSAKDAVAVAVAAQLATIGHAWPEHAALRVRMGLHTGEPLSAAEGYVGLGVHRAARICSAGHGGQILLSQTTRDLIEADLPSNVNLRDLGEHRLKDLQRPERVFQVLHPDLPASFPPLKSLQSAPETGPVSGPTAGRPVADRLRRTKLVGRTDQLGRLVERLDRLST